MVPVQLLTSDSFKMKENKMALEMRQVFKTYAVPLQRKTAAVDRADCEMNPRTIQAGHGHESQAVPGILDAVP